MQLFRPCYNTYFARIQFAKIYTLQEHGRRFELPLHVIHGPVENYATASVIQVKVGTVSQQQAMIRRSAFFARSLMPQLLFGSAENNGGGPPPTSAMTVRAPSNNERCAARGDCWPRGQDPGLSWPLLLADPHVCHNSYSVPIPVPIPVSIPVPIHIFPVPNRFS